MCLRTSCAYYAIACFPALSALCDGCPLPLCCAPGSRKTFSDANIIFSRPACGSSFPFIGSPLSCALLRPLVAFSGSGRVFIGAAALRPSCGLQRGYFVPACAFRQQAAGVVSCSPGSAAGGAEKPIKKACRVLACLYAFLSFMIAFAHAVIILLSLLSCPSFACSALYFASA